MIDRYEPKKIFYKLRVSFFIEIDCVYMKLIFSKKSINFYEFMNYIQSVSFKTSKYYTRCNHLTPTEGTNKNKKHLYFIINTYDKL